MEINPSELPWKSVYKILIGSIVPRPIGWISSINLNGQPNLAPFSFFNIVCANPPHVVFSPMIRSTDQQPKDTLINVRATGEFVVNIATFALAEAVNISSTEFRPDVNEFERAGLDSITSSVVRPPRVAQSPIHFECRVAHIVDLGSIPGAGSVVIGEIVHIHVDESVLIGTDKIDLAKLDPIARLAGNAYCRVTETFELIRPATQLKE